MQWCPSVGTTFHSSSTVESETGSTVKFSSTISDEEFVPLIPQHLNTGYICTATHMHTIQPQSGYHCCMQTSWRDSDLFANCIKQPERKLPRPSLIMHFERGHACMYQRACINNHYLVEHLRENYHQSIIFLKCCITVKTVNCFNPLGLRFIWEFSSRSTAATLTTSTVHSNLPLCPMAMITASLYFGGVALRG